MSSVTTEAAAELATVEIMNYENRQNEQCTEELAQSWLQYEAKKDSHGKALPSH